MYFNMEVNKDIYIKQFHEYFSSRTPSFKDFFQLLVMQNDALMHLESLKGFNMGKG